MDREKNREKRGLTMVSVARWRACIAAQVPTHKAKLHMLAGQLYGICARHRQQCHKIDIRLTQQPILNQNIFAK